MSLEATQLRLAGLRVPTGAITTSISSFFSRLFTRSPTGGLTAARARTGTQQIPLEPRPTQIPVKTAIVGGTIVGTTAALTLTEGGRELVQTTGQITKDVSEILGPIAKAGASFGETVASSPLILGGLILLGGVLLLKR